jgi:hypothetical protein
MIIFPFEKNQKSKILICATFQLLALHRKQKMFFEFCFVFALLPVFPGKFLLADF